MNPQEAEQRLFDSVAGRIGPADQKALDAILERDPALKRTAVNVAFARDRLGRLDGLLVLDPSAIDAAPPPTVESGREESSTLKSRRRPPLHLVGAGLLVLLLGVGTWLLLSRPGKKEENEGPVTKKAETTTKAVSPRPKPRPRPPKPGPVKPVKEPGDTVRPIAVQPGVEMLLPRLLTSPSQLQLERIWAAIEKRPASATAIRTRIPAIPEEKGKVAFILALAAANRDVEVRFMLADFLKTASSPAIRRAAAGALGHTPGKDHVLVEAAGGLSVRAGMIDDPEQRRLLLDAAAAERDSDVLGTLVRLLAPSREKDETIGAQLFELARSTDSGLRRAAIDGLRSGKGDDVELLKTLVADSAIPVSERALLVSAAGGEAGDLPYYEGLIDGSSEIEIRVAATEALAKAWTKGAADTARRVFLDTEYPRKVRLAALAVLAARNPIGVKELATRAKESDEDEEVRKAAEELLRAMDPKPEKEAKEGD